MQTLSLCFLALHPVACGAASGSVFPGGGRRSGDISRRLANGQKPHQASLNFVKLWKNRVQRIVGTEWQPLGEPEVAHLHSSSDPLPGISIRHHVPITRWGGLEDLRASPSQRVYEKGFRTMVLVVVYVLLPYVDSQRRASRAPLPTVHQLYRILRPFRAGVEKEREAAGWKKFQTLTLKPSMVFHWVHQQEEKAMMGALFASDYQGEGEVVSDLSTMGLEHLRRWAKEREFVKAMKLATGGDMFLNHPSEKTMDDVKENWDGDKNGDMEGYLKNMEEYIEDTRKLDEDVKDRIGDLRWSDIPSMVSVRAVHVRDSSLVMDSLYCLKLDRSVLLESAGNRQDEREAVHALVGVRARLRAMPQVEKGNTMHTAVRVEPKYDAGAGPAGTWGGALPLEEMYMYGLVPLEEAEKDFRAFMDAPSDALGNAMGRLMHSLANGRFMLRGNCSIAEAIVQGATAVRGLAGKAYPTAFPPFPPADADGSGAPTGYGSARRAGCRPSEPNERRRVVVAGSSVPWDILAFYLNKRDYAKWWGDLLVAKDAIFRTHELSILSVVLRSAPSASP